MTIEDSLRTLAESALRDSGAFGGEIVGPGQSSTPGRIIYKVEPLSGTTPIKVDNINSINVENSEGPFELPIGFPMDGFRGESIQLASDSAVCIMRYAMHY